MMNKKTKGIGFGIFLILIGALWILSKADVVDVYIWKSFLKLWPLIFIVLGFSIIFDHRPILKSSLWLGFFVIIVLYGIFGNLGKARFEENEYDGNLDTYTHSELLNNTKEAHLTISSGGARFNIKSGKDDLIYAKIRDKRLVFDVERGKEAYIDIFSEFQSKGISELGDEYLWNVDIHKDVIWNIILKTGAVDANLDFSDIKVRELKLDTGASNTKIEFSDRMDKTFVDINSGVSNIEILIPENIGVKIDFDGALVVKNFTDLNLKKEGEKYYSANYDEADKKIEFKMDMAMGNVEIKHN